MFHIANFDGVETQSLSVDSTGASFATFAGGIQAASFACETNDVFVDFDQPADAGSFLIKKDVTHDQINFGKANVQKIYAKTASSTATLYILGVRG